MRLIKRKFKKELSIRLNASLITPITKKPREVRMGKGKGQRLCWESNVKKGMIIFEVGGNVRSSEELHHVLSLVQQKMPVSTSIVKLTY
jgi:large subunit ribosomal protein L16